jgi:hypothetical protein
VSSVSPSGAGASLPEAAEGPALDRESIVDDGVGHPDRVMEGVLDGRTFAMRVLAEYRGCGVNGDTNAGGSLFGDAIIAFLLLNEARHRIVCWVFGTPREHSNRMTVFAIGSVADGVQGGAAKVLAAGALPSVGAVALGAAAMKEAAHGIAGEKSRTMPLFGALIAFAVVGNSFGPIVRGTYHGAQTSMHGLRVGSRRVLAFVGGH